MTHQICRDDIYANARVDAGVAEAIAGVNEEPFWVQAQTNLIRWVRTGHRLAGEPEPGIRSVAETARNTAKLETLITSALYRAGTGDKLAEARELERWLTHDWLRLDTALTYRLTHTLAEAGAQDITVTSRDGLHRTPVGERTGSWDRWDPTSLPEDACRAAQKALTELRGESPCTIDENPEARDTTRQAVRQPKGTAFGVMDERHRHDRAGRQRRQGRPTRSQEGPHAPEQSRQDPEQKRETTPNPRPEGSGKTGGGSKWPGLGDKPASQPGNVRTHARDGCPRTRGDRPRTSGKATTVPHPRGDRPDQKRAPSMELERLPRRHCDQPPPWTGREKPLVP